MNKFYVLRYVIGTENSSTSYVKRFESLGTLVTFIVKEFDIFNKDINFDDFDIRQIIENDDTFGSQIELPKFKFPF